MYKRYLIFGGAGLCGVQVARQLVEQTAASRITIASLKQQEAEQTCESLIKEFSSNKVEFVPAWGNVLVPWDLSDKTRQELLKDSDSRHQLLQSVYGDIDAAFEANHLVRMVRTHTPEVIVDAMNTATGFSYQDVFDGAQKVREWISMGRDHDDFDTKGTNDLEGFLLSQSVPQLIRHITMLNRVACECKTQMYVKIGTCGSGGMGLNIPFTHSEDRPSKKLLAKTEAAFGHTGLLFLMARTPGSPIVKEIKPAAMIGYRRVAVRTTADKYGNSNVFKAKKEELELSNQLALRQTDGEYDVVSQLRMAVVDTGENGIFTAGELGAITTLGSMEFVTPEEVAQTVVSEIRGATTGHDVIAALDGSVVDPSYKAGLLRSAAMNALRVCEKDLMASAEKSVPSIALGCLGPPELSKNLFEAALFEEAYGTFEAMNSTTETDEEMAQHLAETLPRIQVDTVAPSIGIPILLPDGKTILRGPRINVPEMIGHATEAVIQSHSVDAWAKKGWVDLRPANMRRWRRRLETIAQSRADMREQGTAVANHKSYLANEFHIGDIAGWINNNELLGYRIDT